MEVLLKEMRTIFQSVQNSTSCHQKNVILLSKLYKKVPRDEFSRVFLNGLYLILCHNSENNFYTKRVLSFVSHFCADITKMEGKENGSHNYLTTVIDKVLQWGSCSNYDVRYNCCCFIGMVLQDIGEEVQLEVNLIDEIQEVLLEQMSESKIPIRLVAMSALVRLQDPQNFECPVINAYMQALTSPSANIRKDAVEKIAPNMITLPKIKDRVKDVDISVKTAAFRKCADIGPQNFRIADKHLILICGFQETNQKVKHCFFDYLLQKWLTAYKGDYLKFVGALKLIADEEDINIVTYLCRELVKDFYIKEPLEKLIAALPIDEEKIISVDHLNNDLTLFWNILTSLMRESGNMDEYLNQILPEMTSFCNYLDKVITTKSKEKMDEWKYFEYQFDLLNLLDIVENYDFSDEVGRRTIRALTTKILQNHNFSSKLTKKLVSIAHKCSSNVEFFTHDMCQIISEIREPLMDEPLSQDQTREQEFKAAELRVKINILKERQNEAISERDYQRAQQLDTEILSHNKQLENLQPQVDGEKVRVTKSDNETLCRCLDILIAVLELPSISKMTPSLITCKNNFVVPLFSLQESEPHWRIVRCLSLFSVIDRPIAEEFAKDICMPISTYRTIPINNVAAMVQSICIVTDLVCLYGTDILGQGDEVSSNMTTDQSSIKRKLYRNDVEEEVSNGKIDNMTLPYIFEIFLDMLDDEREEIRHKAMYAISCLVKAQFPVTPTMVSRILLKWYNPLTEQQDGRLQIHLGLLIETYTCSKNSGEVIKDAIIPTLMSIARAPRTSPLVDIDIDNVLHFLSEMMNVHFSKDELRILALDFCMKIAEDPRSRLVGYLTKLLFQLDVQHTGAESMSELIERASNLLEDVSDRLPRKYIQKFISKLKEHPQKSTTTIETVLDGPSSSVLQELTAGAGNDGSLRQEPQQVKRRKSRNTRNCVVVLERMTIPNDFRNESTLHPISEMNQEMEVDEDFSIETPTSDSSESSKIRANSVVISETSDSDFRNENEMVLRRSARCRKKRIV